MSYQSLVDNNKGNEPCFSPSQWSNVITGAGASSPSAPEYSVQAYGPGATLTSDPSITINTTTHNIGTPLVNGEFYANNYTSLQAAVNAAGSNSHIIVPQGTYTLSSTLTIYNNNVDFDCRGAVIVTDTATTDAVQIGDPTKNFYQTATYVKFRNCQFEPGVQQSAGAMIHDNGYGTTIVDDVTVAANGSNYWHNVIQVDQDESAWYISGTFKATPRLSKCDSGYCGNYLYNPLQAHSTLLWHGSATHSLTQSAPGTESTGREATTTTPAV